MGSTKVSTPAPPATPPMSAGEKDIQKAQLKLMQKQVAQLDAMEPLFQASLDATAQAQKDQQLLKPFVLQGLGLKQNEDGSFSKMTEEEFIASLSSMDKAAYENTLLALERDRKALMGELPLTVAGQQAKAKEFKDFKEAMARAGHVITGDDPGTASATSTAGIQALQAFNERFGLLEEAERFGQLNLASSMALAKMGIATDIGASKTAGLLQFPGASISGTQVGAPNYGGTAGQYASLLQPYQFNRSLQFQSNMAGFNANVQAQQQSAANTSALYGSLLGLGGTIAGVGLGAYGALKKSAPKQTP